MVSFLSRTKTSAPRWISASASQEPIKPAPPVTKTGLFFHKLLNESSSPIFSIWHFPAPTPHLKTPHHGAYPCTANNPHGDKWQGVIQQLAAAKRLSQR